jgi:hypothetical protein
VALGDVCECRFPLRENGASLRDSLYTFAENTYRYVRLPRSSSGHKIIVRHDMWIEQ